MIGALLAELLSEIGHDVCSIVTTEVEAIVAAARDSPDLMIVDAQLRQGSGMAAMETIWQRGAVPHIFMTGGSRLNIPGNAVVLRKPFSTTELTAAIDGVVWRFAAP